MMKNDKIKERFNEVYKDQLAHDETWIKNIHINEIKKFKNKLYHRIGKQAKDINGYILTEYLPVFKQNLKEKNNG